LESETKFERPVSRSFYAATVGEFLVADPAAIVGTLSSRHVGSHKSAEGEQIRAWERQIEILRDAFRTIGPRCFSWALMLEMSLLRLGKRLDTVVLSPGVVNVIEFKIGKSSYASADRYQTEVYAQGLRDFHEVSQSRRIVPILCADVAPSRPVRVNFVENVADVIEANASTLSEALVAFEAPTDGFAEPDTWFKFESSAYRPTPTIVEAAQSLYAGHQIADIGRGDAADLELQAAADLLRQIVEQAQQEGGKTVCFVTGAPGAGKTLLGLNLALASRGGKTPAALLSGNRPLVHVLTEALAQDAAERTGQRKGEAKRQADSAIQNLLGYLKEHTDGATPPENVIVFDEAQRAWDAEVGQKLMGRPQSEPELFLAILDRLDWACLVCLVGPGQEINRGEGGLALWGEALAKFAQSGRIWTVVAAPQAIDGGTEVSGAGLGATRVPVSHIRHERRIHLANSMRTYRNNLHGKWVAALLEGDITAAQLVTDEMTGPPALVARDLKVAKDWLKERRRGRSVGLLASSGAVRLVAEGIPPAPRSSELDQIGHWFLKPYQDFRSASALEIPMSEFGCQGLEIDYAGLCWGGDLIWTPDGWLARKMSGVQWQVRRSDENRRFRINGYRVLLTRARAGLVIYVPLGDDDDATRSPDEFNATYQCLVRAGCAELW